MPIRNSDIQPGNPAAALTDDTLREIGHDSTSTFETRGNYAGSNPTENASSENLSAAADKDDDLEDDDEEVVDPDTDDDLEDDDEDDEEDDDLDVEDEVDEDEDEEEDDDEDDDDEDDLDADDEEDEEEDPDTLKVDADANSDGAIRSRLSESEKSARGRNVPNTRHTA